MFLSCLSVGSMWGFLAGLGLCLSRLWIHFGLVDTAFVSSSGGRLTSDNVCHFFFSFVAFNQQTFLGRGDEDVS